MGKSSDCKKAAQYISYLVESYSNFCETLPLAEKQQLVFAEHQAFVSAAHLHGLLKKTDLHRGILEDLKLKHSRSNIILILSNIPASMDKDKLYKLILEQYEILKTRNLPKIIQEHLQSISVTLSEKTKWHSSLEEGQKQCLNAITTASAEVYGVMGSYFNTRLSDLSKVKLNTYFKTIMENFMKYQELLKENEKLSPRKGSPEQQARYTHTSDEQQGGLHVEPSLTPIELDVAISEIPAPQITLEEVNYQPISDEEEEDKPNKSPRKRDRLLSTAQKSPLSAMKSGQRFVNHLLKRNPYMAKLNDICSIFDAKILPFFEYFYRPFCNSEKGYKQFHLANDTDSGNQKAVSLMFEKLDNLDEEITAFKQNLSTAKKCDETMYENSLSQAKIIASQYNTYLKILFETFYQFFFDEHDELYNQILEKFNYSVDQKLQSDLDKFQLSSVSTVSQAEQFEMSQAFDAYAIADTHALANIQRDAVVQAKSAFATYEEMYDAWQSTRDRLDEKKVRAATVL